MIFSETEGIFRTLIIACAQELKIFEQFWLTHRDFQSFKLLVDNRYCKGVTQHKLSHSPVHNDFSDKGDVRCPPV